MAKNSEQVPFGGLDAFAPGQEEVNAIIETPKGSRNKFKYDPELGLFRLNKVLPAGAVFPFDFGFIPSTLGGDGDPLDVLVLMDESAFTGCLIWARLIGVIEADQTEQGKTKRNDRLIAVAAESFDHAEVHELDQISANLVSEIEHFFVSYDQIEGKQFNPIGRFGSERAKELVRAGIAQFEQARSDSKHKQK